MKPRHIPLPQRTCVLVIGLLFLFGSAAYGQGQVKWLIRGSLQSFYSEQSFESENDASHQQYGLRWPGQYLYQDLQARKAFWIGDSNFTDQFGNTPTYTVVHVGPRLSVSSEFMPVSFNLYAKDAPPQVSVDGTPTFSQSENLAGVDNSLKADRMLVITANTPLGITVTRKVYQFSQQYHDNYHISEYTFKNTGYYKADNSQLPPQTLTNLWFFWQYGYAVSHEQANFTAQAAMWGKWEMNDARGPWYVSEDGITDLKAQFAWQGFSPTRNLPKGVWPGASGYTNIGGPIFEPSTYAAVESGIGRLVDVSDSLWRLGAAQFVGNVSIHAPKSASDTSDDPNQPRTTTYVDSDNSDEFNNSMFSVGQNAREFAWMSKGKDGFGHDVRQARKAEVSGEPGFRQPSADASLGTSGGWSSANGYGPYRLAPGDSVTIVWAEAANGLSREECIRIGKKYRDGLLGATGPLNDKAKNDSVFLGRDRLITSFRRAVGNYATGYNIPQPPNPPAKFEVAGLGNRISLSWTPNANESANGFRGYRIYRAWGKVDSTFYPIFECGGTANPLVVYSYDDVTAIRGQSYYYYITAWGDPARPADPVTLTPAGSLESSRFFTQTYAPASLKRPAPPTDSIAARFRIVPNPYAINSAQSLRWDVSDRIGFLNTPGNCKIKIFTELGELVKELEHNDGTGDMYWNSVTSSNQVIVSGVYIVLVEDRDTGKKLIRKLVVIR